jgi:hypothetical protein
MLKYSSLAWAGPTMSWTIICEMLGFEWHFESHMTNFSWQGSSTHTSLDYTLWPKDECESESLIFLVNNSMLILSCRMVPKLLDKTRRKAEQIGREVMIPPPLSADFCAGHLGSTTPSNTHQSTPHGRSKEISKVRTSLGVQYLLPQMTPPSGPNFCAGE